MDWSLGGGGGAEPGCWAPAGFFWTLFLSPCARVRNEKTDEEHNTFLPSSLVILLLASVCTAVRSSSSAVPLRSAHANAVKLCSKVSSAQPQYQLLFTLDSIWSFTGTRLQQQRIVGVLTLHRLIHKMFSVQKAEVHQQKSLFPNLYKSWKAKRWDVTRSPLETFSDFQSTCSWTLTRFCLEEIIIRQVWF